MAKDTVRETATGSIRKHEAMIKEFGKKVLPKLKEAVIIADRLGLAIGINGENFVLVAKEASNG